MNELDFIRIISICQGLDNYPNDKNILTSFFKIISQKIKDTKTLESCVFKYLSDKRNSLFPKPAQLLVYLLKPLPVFDGKKILEGDGYFNLNIRRLLKERYQLIIPDISDDTFQKRGQTQTVKWLDNIQFALNRLAGDYNNGVLDESEIFVSEPTFQVARISTATEMAKRVNWLKWEINFEMENLADYENRGKEKAIVITKRTIEKYRDELQERTGDRWNLLINQ